MSDINPYNINLDIENIKKSIKTNIVFMQNDNLYNVFYIKIFKTTNNVATEIDYSLISSSTITFKQSNGIMIQRNLTFDNVNKYYYYSIEDEILQISGAVVANVQLTGSLGQRISTNYFVFQILKDNIDDNSFVVTNEYPILKTFVKEVQDLLEEGNSVINEVISTNGGLGSNITIGNALDSTLKGDVSTGNSLHSTLTSDISSGNALKNTLETDIANATTKKTDLENVINTANLTTYASVGSLNSKIKTMTYTSIADNVTNVVYNLSYDNTKDELQVFDLYSGGLLSLGEHYTENSPTSILLSGWSLKNGDKLKLQVLKGIK